MNWWAASLCGAPLGIARLSMNMWVPSAGRTHLNFLSSLCSAAPSPLQTTPSRPPSIVASSTRSSECEPSRA